MTLLCSWCCKIMFFFSTNFIHLRHRETQKGPRVAVLWLTPGHSVQVSQTAVRSPSNSAITFWTQRRTWNEGWNWASNSSMNLDTQTCNMGIRSGVLSSRPNSCPSQCIFCFLLLPNISYTPHTISLEYKLSNIYQNEALNIFSFANLWSLMLPSDAAAVLAKQPKTIIDKWVRLYSMKALFEDIRILIFHISYNILFILPCLMKDRR